MHSRISVRECVRPSVCRFSALLPFSPTSHSLRIDVKYYYHLSDPCNCHIMVPLYLFQISHTPFPFPSFASFLLSLQSLRIQSLLRCLLPVMKGEKNTIISRVFLVCFQRILLLCLNYVCPTTVRLYSFHRIVFIQKNPAKAHPPGKNHEAMNDVCVCMIKNISFFFQYCDWQFKKGEKINRFLMLSKTICFFGCFLFKPLFFPFTSYSTLLTPPRAISIFFSLLG